MAPQSDRQILPEETFNLIREKAKESDEFTVKVMRRAHMGAVPLLEATLSGANVQHFVNPELWLPNLCGGGNFTLQAWHASDTARPVGGFLQFKVDQPTKAVDHATLKKPDWRGPSVLDYPQKEAPREAQQGSIYELSPPPAPGSGDSATRSPQAWPRQAGGGSVHSSEYGGEPAWQGRAHFAQMGALEAERRKLEDQRLENEKQRHRDEIDSLKKSHEADMRSFKAEILSEVRSKPVDTGSNAIVEMLKAQAEDRREAAKQAAEDRRAAETRAAEERRAAEARQERADERMNKLLEKMSDRPKEDPLAIIEKVSGLLGKNNNNDATMKMMGSMAEMHSMQIGTAMDFIEHAANMQLGGGGKDESPIVKGIEAAVKGVASMVRAGGAKRPAQQFAQPQIPQTFDQQARQQQQPQQAPPPPPRDTRTILEQIESGIRGKFPIAQVADALFTHFNDPSIQTALLAAGGDIEALIQTRLGNWQSENPENKAYVDALFKEVETRAAAAGFFEEEPAPEEGADENPDEGDENAE